MGGQPENKGQKQGNHSSSLHAPSAARGKGAICAGLLAHVDAGKTTLSESILYLSGSIRRLGRVDNKDAFLDTYTLEKERGITIFSKQARIMLEDQPFTLLDTPGHVDFSAEMERTLQVLDYGILVISGADGVQGHTRTLWRLLQRYDIPVFIFVNKMDQKGTDRQALLRAIQEQLGDNCLDFGEPKERLMEALAMCDEQALEIYLEKDTLDDGVITELIRKRRVFPCFFGSALKLTGVEALLAGMLTWMRAPAYGDTFGARVYKIARDAQGNRLTYMKITGGSLRVRSVLQGSAEQNREEKVNQIRLYNGAKYETVEAASAGTVCAVTGLNDTRAGDGLGMERERQLPLLEPVLTYQIQLPEGSDTHKALMQLRQLEEEEPELHIVWEELSGEILVQLMGEIQTEVLQQLIRERFHMEVRFGTGQIIYKETIAEPVEGVGHFEPLRHYAEVHLLMAPDEPGSGLSFDSSCSEDVLDRNWQRLILTHLEEKVHRGVLTGAPITDMRITLTAGRAHLKHTEGGDFRQATYRAVRQGLKKAKSVLLEPYYRFRLELPQKLVGHAMADLERMNGSFELAEGSGEDAVLTGMAPVSAMREYQKEVAAYTSGSGRLFCMMAGYYPCQHADEVIAAIGYDSERDLENPTGSVFCAHGAGFVVPWYEVARYMHLASTMTEEMEPERPMTEADDAGATTAAGSGSMGRSLADDKELEAIFVRTYGEIRRRKPQRSSVIRAEAPGERSMGNPGAAGADAAGAAMTGDRPRRSARQRREQGDPYLLVDGYNIIFSWEELRELSEHSMEAARSKLMDILSNYQGYTQTRVILVFDAYRVEGFPGEVIHWHNIDVVYTREAETADQYIEKTAHAIGRRYKVTVATSDGLEQVIIRSQGCLLMSAGELWDEIQRVNTEIRQEHLMKARERGNYLLNYLPEEDAARMEALRRGETSDEGPEENGH